MEINTYDNIYSLNLHKSQTQNGKPYAAEADSSSSSTELNTAFGTDSVELSEEAREILFKSQESGKEEETKAEDKSSKNEVSVEEEKDQKQIDKLEARDREVRIHEQQHKSVGGIYAGPINYEFQTGPDGKRYAVGGHVNFNVGAESTPEASIRKADVIYKAALAPAEPSGADHNVASAAMKLKANAQAELQAEKQEEISEDKESKAVNSPAPKPGEKEAAELKTKDSNSQIKFGTGGPTIVTEQAQMSPSLNLI